MGGVGIIGTGISGMQLALYLQMHNVDTTVYAPLSIDGHRRMRLPNCVMRWAPTVERERKLDAFHWEGNDVSAVHLRVVGDEPLSFTGRLTAPANTTDFRLYVPRLMETYANRGGKTIVLPCSPASLPSLAERHDLIVVAAGRDGFGGVFARDASRSPNQGPRRHLTAGLYNGVAWPEPAGVEFSMSPGVGEIFHVCFHSFDGPTSVIAVEGIPGGPLAALSEMNYDADPRAFESTLLDLVTMYAPSIRERVDLATFGLARPVDLLQGRLAPVVRRGWTAIERDKYAVAVGDAWILNDPIGAQGANLGSRCAFELGDMIAGGGPFDESFCRHAENRLWALAEAPTTLSNALLDPPPEHVVRLLVQATVDERVADRFANGFAEPEKLVAALAPQPVPS